MEYKTEVGPISPKGVAVDWWFAYKLPKLPAAGENKETTGYEYLYFDSASVDIELAPTVLTHPESALKRSLLCIHEHPGPSTGWILYNDEMPSDEGCKDADRYGHTKGALIFDVGSKTAMWLVHSWPKFIDLESDGMPVPTYGQTFMCVALDIESIERLAQQLIDHQEPQVYHSNIPDALDGCSALHQLAKGSDPNADGDSDVLDFVTRGGFRFKVIAKNRKWGRDFWNDLVGPTLQADMLVETWIRGPVPPIEDSDGVHEVNDVKFIDLRPLGFPFTWPETRDHAKWGLTKTDDWLCVGDINRMVSQEKRGGGTVAFQHPRLWEILQKVDLIVPPPGLNEEDARSLIKSTHSAPTSTSV